MLVFSGRANPLLAESICKYLDIPLGETVIRDFSDKEIYVRIEENVRGRDVFVIQPTCYPGNTNVMELLIMIDALRRSSAKKDHLGNPLLRLRASGSQMRTKGADHL